MKIRKRPLCLTALALAVVLLCLPAELFRKASPDVTAHPEILTGTICRMEPGGMTVWLTKTNYPDAGIILVSFEAEPSVSIGNTIRIENYFKIRKPEAPTNPGQFDAKLYYQTKGIGLLCYAKDATVIRDDVRWMAQLLYELQESLSARVRGLFPVDKSGVLEAMLLGNKTDLEAETKSLYQKSGISHPACIRIRHDALPFFKENGRFTAKLGSVISFCRTVLRLSDRYGNLCLPGCGDVRASDNRGNAGEKL